MSLLIKGMEMPKNCWDCEVGGAQQMDNATCPFYSMEYWEQENYQDKIADGCPLVPVPPHGRLIDADALYEKFLLLESEAMSALQTTSIGSVDGIMWSAILTERTGYKFDIVDAPTIIPADPAEEGEP